MSQVKDQFITNAAGKKVAVIVSLQTFDSLNEDLHDLRVIAERKKEPTVSFDTMNKKFFKDKR